MRWIEEPNKSHPQWPYHVLTTEQDEPLSPALVEYWKRILTDGYTLAPSSRTSLAVEVLDRTLEADDLGYTSATFHNSVNKQSEGIGTYLLRSEHFTFLQGKGEDDAAFGRRELIWLLDQYTALKAALQGKEVWPLFERINSPQALPVRAATMNGWFDLQAGQEGFGPLPSNDRLLLAGKERIPEDPMETLTSGVIDVPQMKLVEELTAALIQYTPPHFKTILCTITDGVEQGQRALFYEIQCPEFPDQGTTVPNDWLHRAATSFVQHLTAEQGMFPGVRIKLDLQADGSWLHSLEFIKKVNPGE